ncbi:MAG: ABC transporter substrate-binding protein [Candidatus Tectimicrobiota bacterium]
MLHNVDETLSPWSRARGSVILSLLLAGLGLLLLYGLTRTARHLSLVDTNLLQASRVDPGPFPKRLLDPGGVTHVLPAPPQRIVSTVLSGDEMLLDLARLDQIAAVTPYIDTPGMSNSTGRVPATIPRLQANAEAIIAVQPDLVLVASYNRSEEVRVLVAAGMPLLRLGNFASFQEVMANIITLGAAVGVEARATALVQQMQQRLAAVERRVQGRPRPRVLYYAPGGSTVGADTLIDEMIERAGGRNVTREVHSTGWPNLPLELVLRLQPEVLIIPVWSLAADADVARTHLQDPLWQQVPAVQHGRVYAIRGAWLTTISQHAVQGVEAMARCLHPEGFES